MCSSTKGLTTRSFFPITAALILTLGVLAAPVMAQQGNSSDSATQNNEVVVPTFWFIQADDGNPTLTSSDYLSKNNNKKVKVTETEWDLIANNRSDTKVEFTVSQNFTNQSASIKRDVELEIVGGSGSWDGETDGPASGNSASVSSTAATTLAFGTLDLVVRFVHNSSDQPSSADSNVDSTNSADSNYYAPDGTYKTTVTGTISAP